MKVITCEQTPFSLATLHGGDETAVFAEESVFLARRLKTMSQEGFLSFFFLDRTAIHEGIHTLQSSAMMMVIIKVLFPKTFLKTALLPNLVGA